MKWLAGAVLLLVIAILLGLDLLAYAMYVLLAVMLISRFLTRNWAESLAASRECNRLIAEVGDPWDAGDAFEHEAEHLA